MKQNIHKTKERKNTINKIRIVEALFWIFGISSIVRLMWM